MLTDGHFLYPSLDLRSYSTCFTLYSMYNKMHIEADYVMSKYGLQLNNSYLQLQLGQNYAFNCMFIFISYLHWSYSFVNVVTLDPQTKSA